MEIPYLEIPSLYWDRAWWRYVVSLVFVNSGLINHPIIHNFVDSLTNKFCDVHPSAYPQKMVNIHATQIVWKNNAVQIITAKPRAQCVDKISRCRIFMVEFIW